MHSFHKKQNRDGCLHPFENPVSNISTVFTTLKHGIECCSIPSTSLVRPWESAIFPTENNIFKTAKGLATQCRFHQGASSTSFH